MARDVPNWITLVGVEVRLRTNDATHEPNDSRMAELLNEIEEREMRANAGAFRQLVDAGCELG